MKSPEIFLLLVVLFSCKVVNKNEVNLNKIKWIHGTDNCKENTDLPIQVVRYNYNTWILRQNKCVHYEAPFLFLFMGKKKALLMDTGATENETAFPLFKTVTKLVEDWEKTNKAKVELIIAHTHNHGDHTAADIQFKNKVNTTVVGWNVDDIKSYFKIENWPVNNGIMDLGGRVMEIIPIPGHQKASIALYDNDTKILLTGDSFYPGRLYINDWNAYKLSTQRLLDFTRHRKISYILGNHIEMTRNRGKDYPMGTTHQPEEHQLPLNKKQLVKLNNALKRMGEKPVYEVHDKFIVYPKQ